MGARILETALAAALCLGSLTGAPAAPELAGCRIDVRPKPENQIAYTMTSNAVPPYALVATAWEDDEATAFDVGGRAYDWDASEEIYVTTDPGAAVVEYGFATISPGVYDYEARDAAGGVLDRGVATLD